MEVTRAMEDRRDKADAAFYAKFGDYPSDFGAPVSSYEEFTALIEQCVREGRPYEGWGYVPTDGGIIY